MRTKEMPWSSANIEDEPLFSLFCGDDGGYDDSGCDDSGCDGDGSCGDGQSGGSDGGGTGCGH